MDTTGTPSKPTETCPSGHDLATQTGKLKCTKVRCAQATAERPKGALDLDALAKLGPAEAAFQSRKSIAKMPSNLKGDAATKWAAEKMVELLPEAVANVAYDLRYGTEKQREAATERVLKANGMDRKEANNGGSHGLIVLQLGEGDAKIPWLQRMSPKTDDKK
jgi:hypothetical protein